MDRPLEDDRLHHEEAQAVSFGFGTLQIMLVVLFVV